MDFAGEAVNFRHPSLLQGWRQVYYPSVSYPMRTPLFYVTPKVGVNYTALRLPRHGSAPTRRARCPFSAWTAAPASSAKSIGAGATWCRRSSRACTICMFRFAIRRSCRCSTPRSRISISPASSARTSSAGRDRINDANQITAAAITRLINPVTGVGNAACAARSALLLRAAARDSGQRVADHAGAVQRRSRPTLPARICWLRSPVR